jgi:proteic killer suppression protein
MIRSYRDRRTADFAAGKRVKAFQPFERQAQRRLRILADADRIEDLAALPSNHFEALGGDRVGRFSIRINKQWRVCFRFHDGDAFDVEITDYH